MKFRIMRRFVLQAAHHLPRTPDGHKCKRMHGHTYEVELWFEGDVDETAGWFMDFSEIDELYDGRVHTVLDHTLLNDTIENPTTENLCVWIARAVNHPRLFKVVARENGHSAVEYFA
jgi:6-pyruvoyltetrahydropterin/6-carboxytetrahydropterin synthase